MAARTFLCGAGPRMDELIGRLRFIQESERLKDVLRSAHTSSGRRESTAEHSWRLCLMALTFADRLGSIDLAKLFKICIVHDLGEALHGDVPAVDQAGSALKSAREKQDLQAISKTLPPALQDEILALWEDYEHAVSKEARIVKALDKLETIIQHNQGANPPDFDYAFNLHYGRSHTDAASEPVLAAIRALVDEDTRRHAENQSRVQKRVGEAV